MTDSGTSGEHGSGIIPGWYADPYDANQLRWWDGTQWSDQVSALPAIPLLPETPATTAPAPDTPASAPATVEPAPVEPATVEPLPSRRALRESGTSYRAPERSVTAQHPEAAPLTEPAVEPTAEPVAGPVSAVVPEPAPGSAPEPEPEEEPPAAATVDPLDIFTTPNQTNEEPEIDTPAPAAAPASAQSAWDIPATTQSAWDVPVTADGAAIPTNEAASEPKSVDWGLSPRSRRSQAPAPTDSASGVWVWLIAFSPIIAALTVGYALATANSGSASWMLPAALVVPYLLVLLFAVADRSGLAAQGHENAVPWTWAALTAPVYLFIRGGLLQRETGRSVGPLVAWIVFFVLAIVGLLGYGLVSGHPLLTGLPG
jgi:hypothetical protein